MDSPAGRSQPSGRRADPSGTAEPRVTGGGEAHGARADESSLFCKCGLGPPPRRSCPSVGRDAKKALAPTEHSRASTWPAHA
jgi:hypothetical protein